ncbi:helix-turn-helix domain-containing protein [Flagellimonas nanhaiensis]|uniref:XRE family transcriptional regulator n=1 Tax=Flagellimonas nanhaiensis TaxID=2292706 RepID=A0A371JPJ7_9FLAO|nr:helix-turn-helix transcriptional regulator [Allomuricauda nanhaiensis]RDY59438.1 XRE family transcriptional regulator [Allomuricauda nanhaiensis]
MSQLLRYRKKLNLTQEQLAEKANISVRTIQRIEAGQEIKGHTLEVLSNVLEISKEKLLAGVEQKEVNIRLIKLINLSSLILLILPFGSILLPVIIMYWKKEVNSITKQIVTIQIMWTLLFPIIVMIAVFLSKWLSIGNQIVPITMLFLLLVNVFIIVRNTAEIDKNQRLLIKLNFSIL